MRHTTLIPALFTTATLLLAAPGCKSDSTDHATSTTPPTPATPTTPATMSSLTGDWTLSKLQGVDVASMLPQGAKPPTLNFAPDGKLSGFGGVNRIGGTFDPAQVAAGKIGFSKLFSTRMGGPPELMNLESKFTSLLEKADGLKFSNSGNSLTLTQAGATSLDFVKSK